MPEPFQCPRCQLTVFYKDFDDHCRWKHDLNPRLQCSWCFGAYTWPSMQKYRHMDHVWKCWGEFVARQTGHSAPSTTTTDPSTTTDPPPPPPIHLPPTPTLSNLQHPYARCHPYMNPYPLPLRAHDFPRPLPLSPHPLRFRDQALNLASACVQKYLRLLENDSGAQWFHVSVRLPAYTKFLQAIEARDSHCHTLPFACWCNGATRELEARYRLHRHMIVVCLRHNYFKDGVWNRIRVLRDDRPRTEYQSKYYKAITDTKHFINTIGYVSHRRSRCTFTGQSGPLRDNHFYLAETLPKGYRLPLFMQYENGLLQLLNQQCKNMKKTELVESLHLVRVGFQYRLRIQHIPGLEQGTVLPVTKTFQPCDTPTECMLHLMDGDKLHFERNTALETMDRAAWLQWQADRGNLFFHAVGERLWTPRPFYQDLINNFKPMVDDNRALRSRVARLEADVTRGRQERVDQEREAVKWRGHCADLEQEVKSLLLKMNRMNEGEVARLKRENAELRKRIATLEARGSPK